MKMRQKDSTIAKLEQAAENVVSALEYESLFNDNAKERKA